MARPSDAERIIEWKSRRGRSRQGFEVIHHLDALERHWREGQPSVGVFSDFVPMRIATIIEVFVRESVRGIIDAGEPYIERAESLFKGLKLDFLFAANLHGQRLSLGDIAAHSISVNDITQVTAIFEKLLPGYRDALSSVHDRWSVEVEGQPTQPIISDLDATYAALNRLFTVRHILTHEIPHGRTYDPAEVDSFLDASRVFLKATDEYVIELIKGRVPLTQTGMNIHAADQLEDETTKLAEIYNKVTAVDDVNPELLADSQKKWEAFADSEAALRADLVEGGSMYPMIWSSTKAELALERRKQLQWWLDRNEGDL